MDTMKKYHYFYKITNTVNNHFYYGIHSTDNLDDGYMGSGTRLHRAYQKYGIDAFNKEIIKFFPSRKEASEFEAEMVTESLINIDECYNIKLGGDDGETIGTVRCFDTLEGICKRVPCEEYRNNPNRYSSDITGKICVIDTSTQKNIWIDLDDYDKSIHKHRNADKVLVKTKDNKFLLIPKSADRLITGEVSLFWKGRKHKAETIQKLKDTYSKTHHQQGEKNSQYGTCWITKEGQNLKISVGEVDSYLSDGWVRGRKIKKEV